MQTFKDHFTAMLNGTNPEHPPGAWDLSMPQANMTFNTLRGCTLNKKLSAQMFTHGAFNFNAAHPLAPPGCKATAHQRSIANGGRRGSWGEWREARVLHWTRNELLQSLAFLCPGHQGCPRDQHGAFPTNLHHSNRVNRRANVQIDQNNLQCTQ